MALPLPTIELPTIVLPKYQPPRVPSKIGFLAGSAPVLIFDVSGTMHPARRGQFHHMKDCLTELLDPTQGEVWRIGTMGSSRPIYVVNIN